MRTLTATLTTAQKKSSRKPVVEVIASNKLAGVVNVRRCGFTAELKTTDRTAWPWPETDP